MIWDWKEGEDQILLKAGKHEVFGEGTETPAGYLGSVIDLYLQDQILKGRYSPGQSLLDAGAGSGRNLAWFLENNLKVVACDTNPECEPVLREQYPGAAIDWHQADLADLPFDSESFDHVVCNAVLHFARSEVHFNAMWNELLRVLKPGGTLFIRTCGAMGIEDLVVPLGQGRYRLPDDSDRYLITREKMAELRSNPQLHLLEPVKWVNVDDLRVMMTWVLGRGGNSEA